MPKRSYVPGRRTGSRKEGASAESRVFGGKRYSLTSNHEKKSTAKDKAENFRRLKIKARVVKSPTTDQWLVYTRK